MAQVHAAIAYYHANREAMDAEMAAEEAEYDRLSAAHRAGAGESKSAPSACTSMRTPCSAAVVAGLRARGVDAATALETGAAHWPDEEQLELARSQGRVLFGFNVCHYARLHAAYASRGKPHAGIILAPQQRYAVGEQIRRPLSLMAARTAEDMRNRLEFLSNWG